MKEGALHELPGGWVWTKLEEVCLYPQYGWTTSAKTEGALYLLRTTDITSGNIDWNTVPFCKEEPSDKEKYLLKDGDIVISRAGSVGYSHLIKNPKEAIFASYLIRFRPVINEKYLAYFLKSPFYWISISEKSLGIAIPNVNASKLKQISIPLPPLPEQRAIVSKIEQLFSDLDNGIDNFKKAQAQLKLYRQSVLKAACEGKLVQTEAELARAEGREYEAADVLLACILKERHEKWNGRGKYKEVAALDTSDIPTLPQGWCWTTIEQIADHRLGKMLDKEKNKGELRPYLRNINVRWFEFDLSDVQLMRVLDEELDNVTVREGDLVICEGGEPGRAAVWNRKEPIIIQKALHRVRPFGGVLPTYLTYCLVFDANTGRLEKYFTGTTIKHFTGQSLHFYVFPLPPLAEQRRIVAEVERRLSVSDKMEATIAESLQKAESLRQSILKKAFEGKLLNKKELEKARNAPDWEPAEKLLERIRQEKAQTGEKKKVKMLDNNNTFTSHILK